MSDGGDGDSLFAARSTHQQPIPLHGVQMGSASDQHDIATGELQQRADTAANASGAIDDVSHMDILTTDRVAHWRPQFAQSDQSE